MELKNFALINGKNVTIENGRIRFEPERRKPKKGTAKVITKANGAPRNKEESLQTALIRSDILFGEGSLELKCKIGGYETGVLFIFTKQDDGSIVVGHSGRLNSFVAMDDWSFATPLASAGSFSNYKVGETIHLKVNVNGSQIQLYVNNILFFQTTANIKVAPLEIRLGSYGPSIEVFDIKSHLSKPKLFVVMQFSKEYNELYEEVIKPVVDGFGFNCVRADEFYTTTPILKDIVENIESSKAIIAEITPDNPNVFYEIGYSHAIKKPTILLCDHKREKLPFDISSFRTLFYENTIAGKKKVENSLIKYLEQIK